MLTEHLNQVDKTGNITFAFEEEEHGSIPFIDTKLTRKEDGRVKVEVYRKKTHTNHLLPTTQYITS